MPRRTCKWLLSTVCALLPLSSPSAHAVAATTVVVRLAADSDPDPSARAGRVQGRITDADTGEPLIGANVIVKGTSVGTASDAEGRYVIPNAPDGPVTLVASYLGYVSKEVAVTIRAGTTLNQDFTLAWQTVQGEEVVITAQASGQIAAINQQLSSNTIANIVSADRIQELPDVNAAESVGRLPGVSILRSGGEANQIAIRGLSPKYNTVTVNGVRVPTTGADDRSVDLSLISSIMLDGIEVSKALTPDKDGDAIGGTVDLKLREAPEGLLVDVQGQGGYNALQGSYGNYKLAGSVSNRFFRNRLGLIGSFSADDFDRSADKFSADYQLVDREGDGVLVPRINNLNLNEDAQRRGRVGGSLVADYRIPLGKVMANAFYNRLSYDQTVRSNRFSLESQEHMYNVSRNEGSTSIMTAAAGVEQRLRYFEYDLGASRTQSRRENPKNYWWEFRETGAFDSDSLDRWGPPELVPRAAYNVMETTGFSNLSVSSVDAAENESAVQGNVKIPFRWGGRFTGYVKGGGKFRWMDRENDEQDDGRGLYYGGDQQVRNVIAEALPDLGLEVASQYLTLEHFIDSTYSRPNFLDGEYPLGYTMRLDDLKRVTEVVLDSNYTLVNAASSLGRDYHGKERFGAGYAMAEFNVGRWLTFMPGIRWESEYSRYTGRYIRESGNNQPPVYFDTTSVRKSLHALPMFHLRLKPFSWLNVRLAKTKSLTRPDYMQYAPITFINTWGTYIRTGNPELTPAVADNWDASVSIYQSRVGLLSFSAFRKKIDRLIWWTKFYLLPDQTVLPTFEKPNGIPGVPEVDTSLNNRFEATYEGFEVDWQTNFWYLPGVLKGLVLSVNYTQIVSETTYPQYQLNRQRIPRPPFFVYSQVDTFRVGRMPNQPSHIANVSVGYDYKGFSSRLSFLYQSDTMTWLAPQPANDRFTADYYRVDLALKQELPSGVQLFANFNNLNNRADRNYQASIGAYPTYIEYYGFTMDVGARYRF